MTKKGLIVIIAIVALCILTFLFWTAHLARKASDDLLTQFKKIDNSLPLKNDSLNKQQEGIGAIKMDSSYLGEVELSFKVNKILITIDSIKHDLLLVKDKDKLISFSLKNKERLRTLKIGLLNYNSSIQKSFSDKSNIKQDDFIDVTDRTSGANSIPWEIYYFENANFYSASTLLTFVHQKVLTLQQKVVKSD